MSNNDFTRSENNLPPRNGATDPEFAVQSAATAVAATSSDLWAGYALDAGGLRSPQGKIWVELEATGFDVYVRFCRTGTTGTTVANGSVIRAGVPRVFYLDPSKDLFLDHISPGGVGSIKWRRSGAICERNRV